MLRPFRFAVISDLHIALPETINPTANRFHLVEVSIPALEQVLQRLETEPLDFLLLPGDLTQHGERENHDWLVRRLQALPFPTYVVPGNHDIVTQAGCDRTLSLQEFPQVYQDFGYNGPLPYYHREILPGIHLIGLNSIAFDGDGEQLFAGWVDDAQLAWLSAQLERLKDEWVMVAIHHNVLEHLPGQAKHPMGRRYIVQNRDRLIRQLQAGNVNLVFTGHLHVQDVIQADNLWEITTGSLVSYPHPYRLVTVTPQPDGHMQVQVESDRVRAVETHPDLQTFSQDWMRAHALPFMTKFLTCPPFGLATDKAAFYAQDLTDFWASISAGDHEFDYAHFPDELNQRLKTFGAVNSSGIYEPMDNHVTLNLPVRSRR